MAYIGRSTDKISNIEILDNITFDGSSSYSITKSSVAFTPNSAQSLLISIDGVVQATNFTVSSSTIDFGVAIPSTSTCDFFLHYGTGLITIPADGTVTEAKIGSGAVTTAKIADANVTSAKMFSGFKNGITMSQSWRLSTDTNSGTNADVSTNWEEVDDTIYGSIGTGLTESSGIFSFPQTGIYLLNYVMFTLTTASEATMRLYLEATEDNLNYSQIAHIQHGNEGARTNQGSQNYIFDITDISNQKFKFRTVSFSSGSVLRGGTSTTLTGFTVIRLGDT